MLPRQSVSAVLLCAFAAMSVVISACSGGSSDSTFSASSGPQIIEVPTRWASSNANSLPSLLGSSDAVFAGKVLRLVETRQDRFLPGREGTGIPGKPSRGPVDFPFSVFELQITRSMKGGLSPGSTVMFEQSGGITDQDGTPVRLQLAGDDPIESGREYMFFAAYKKNGALSAPPYGRLEVGTDGRLRPLKHWAHLGALLQLTGRTAVEAGQALKAGQ
jgi:hypothetical protein